ncbi:MAG: type II toxin-antitoxin system prevent-host-death family antitoxin [Verrucomicrobia bacterium]|nr:type II toxin-antitoxin system prevent-host-death family antitoxin [Verrucomicrobiota bacterium]
MDLEITSTEAARRFGDLLAEIRYGGGVAVITKNGEPVAELRPHGKEKSMCLQDFVTFWNEEHASLTRGNFADDLQKVKAADLPAENPWE